MAQAVGQASMDRAQSEKIMQGMIDFIKAHGKERVNEINNQAETDFVVQKEKLIMAKRKQLADQFEKDLNIQEINLKIQKSAEQNKQRIERMQKINEMVSSLEKAAGSALHRRLESNPAEYAELLKNLLIQGLIKLIEPRVILRCREGDVDVLQSVIDDAVSSYK